MAIRGQEINHLLLFCCFFLLVSLPPSSHYPEGQAKTITPLSSLRHSVSGHYRPHLTDGDTKTWGKATPGLCPGVGPRADTCWSPVPFTPASLQPWRARWSLAASRAKHDRLCAETGMPKCSPSAKGHFCPRHCPEMEGETAVRGFSLCQGGKKG